MSDTEKVAIRFQPQRAEIAIDRGVSVLDAAMIGKVAIAHKCGGHGSCGTCKIQIDSKTELCAPNVLERRHLTEERLLQGFRLACQCKITGPATVMVQEDPLRRVVRELLEAQRSQAEKDARQLDEQMKQGEHSPEVGAYESLKEDEISEIIVSEPLR